MSSTSRRLTVAQILRWADEHYRRTGSWPSSRSGRVRGGSDNLTWAGVNGHLNRWSEPGQPNSIARLLQARRGKRNHKNLPRLRLAQIMKWADAHHRRTGRWPVASMRRRIPEAPGETWSSVGSAMWHGRRGLRPRQTLARILHLNRGVRNAASLSPLTTTQILRWADAYRARTGRWPEPRAGLIEQASGETWGTVNSALHRRKRGLRAGLTLPQFLAKHRQASIRVRVVANDADILRWARAHHRRTSRWPTDNCGQVHGKGFKWSAVGQHLRRQHDANGQSRTLSRLLQERLNVDRPRRDLLNWTAVRSWARAFQRRTGHWPTRRAGPVREQPGERWSAVIAAMSSGSRGLPAGSSFRSAAIHRSRPRVTVDRILVWARAHERRTGQWPRSDATPIPESSDGATWKQIDQFLRRCRCGLPTSTTLARLLSARCGVRRRSCLPPLQTPRVIAWAKAFHGRTGTWPRRDSGPIPASNGDTWEAICAALKDGSRGLPRTTLPRMIQAELGVKQRTWGSLLTEDQIVEWAKAHRERTGDWPCLNDGPILEASGRTWRSIDTALSVGLRGLKGGSSLATLLARRVGARNRLKPPPLTIRQILNWADLHYARTGVWPSSASDRVIDEPAEHWKRIHGMLKHGGRGLPGASSLVALLTKARGARYRRQGLPLSVEQIIEWAVAHRKRTGKLPTPDSGPVRGVRGEHWRAIDASLRAGTRNLRGNSSLERLFRGHLADPPRRKTYGGAAG